MYCVWCSFLNRSCGRLFANQWGEYIWKIESFWSFQSWHLHNCVIQWRWHVRFRRWTLKPWLIKFEVNSCCVWTIFGFTKSEGGSWVPGTEQLAEPKVPGGFLGQLWGGPWVAYRSLRGPGCPRASMGGSSNLPLSVFARWVWFSYDEILLLSLLVIFEEVWWIVCTVVFSPNKLQLMGFLHVEKGVTKSFPTLKVTDSLTFFMFCV